jgi:hypothetical protein
MGTSKENRTVVETESGGLECCEMLRIKHGLERRLKGGGEFVSVTHRCAALYYTECFFLYLVLIFVIG